MRDSGSYAPLASIYCCMYNSERRLLLRERHVSSLPLAPPEEIRRDHRRVSIVYLRRGKDARIIRREKKAKKEKKNVTRGARMSYIYTYYLKLRGSFYACTRVRV